jgi:hypothetical protein
VSAAYFDNIQILKAIDDRQQQNEGRKLWMSAHQLLNEISGTFAADPRLMPGFLQELFIAQAAGQLTWRLMDQNANPRDANYYDGPPYNSVAFGGYELLSTRPAVCAWGTVSVKAVEVDFGGITREGACLPSAGGH